LAADEGYKAIVIFTSDNITLYNQTLDRAREAFPGIEILSKDDLDDSTSYFQRVRASTSVTVITKNGTMLDKLNQNFKKRNLKGISALLIDDEADQASPNTRESKEDGSSSPIYDQISELRTFFDKNTYLQVTATPQALFLQAQDHHLRPKFTVLGYPGNDYVGGDDFFSNNSTLTRVFDIAELTTLAAGMQPSPVLHLPPMLTMSLDTFMLAATDKRLKDATSKSAYLCHVSTRKTDHEHIVNLLRFYKRDIADKIKANDPKIRTRLKIAYDDLVGSSTTQRFSEFDHLVEKIEFYSPGIAIKLINGDTDEDVALKSPYNLFVGGNKLGRGVTIKNLLVSYYGRNPKSPQADTVLQHARMFGYRRNDLDFLRLYLPQQLLTTFQAIYKMEKGLRELIANKQSEEFRGIYLEGNVKATRRNVLAPGCLGVYSAGSNYNIAQIQRAPDTDDAVCKIDDILKSVDNKSSGVFPISTVLELVRMNRSGIAGGLLV
jgi:Z1 domain